MKIQYKIYNPSGNITALVMGEEYSQDEKKIINQKIMEENKEVEQVGFLSLKENKLSMAGGEFCGNATRCACKYYLENNKKDNLEIKINNYLIKSGIYDSGEIWCEIPILTDKKLIEKLDPNITKVNLSGITILVVENFDYNKDLKNVAINYIKEFNLQDEQAVGVIFLKENLEIIPIVWVKEINTLFAENSCGSGSIGVSIVQNLKNNQDKFKIKQPSGKFLSIEVCEGLEKVILFGDIEEMKSKEMIL